MLVRMKAGIPVLVMLVAGTARLVAQGDDREAMCKEYLRTPLPAEAQAITQPKTWPDCDSYKSYSGLGRKVDFEAARRCAWQERLAQLADKDPVWDVSNYIGGSAMLATLYANGQGVEQNKPLALRFACEADLAQEGMKSLQALAAAPLPPGHTFVYCDYAMTTPEMNLCTAYGTEIAAQEREDEFSRLSAQWTQAQRDSFARLQKASEEYVRARGTGEVYQGGTIRTMRTMGAEDRMRHKFLEAVKEFESGRLPKGNATDYRKADSDLNETYKQALTLAAKQNFEDDDGAIRPDGIRQAERAWMTYRDAWVAFAKVRYPQTDATAWLTLLARNRYWSLRHTMCQVGWNDPACQGDQDE
jgi:uncharacterized protein YecT (DUF1311 family)